MLMEGVLKDRSRHYQHQWFVLQGSGLPIKVIPYIARREALRWHGDG